MLPIVFMSNEQGAPTLNNAAGSLISVLRACLVTGFNNVGITSVSIAGNVATVVTNANHGLAVGHRATVAGVSITAANGDKTVASVPNATTFTYHCVNSDVSESPASASVKRTPLGWVEQFSKTNVSMFKSSDPAAYGQSLRVADTSTNAVSPGATVCGVGNASDIDSYTDSFPTTVQYTNGLYWVKGANTAGAKAWCIVGDGRFFYMLVENSAYSGYYPGGSSPNLFWSFYVQYFGDIVSNKTSEAFGAIVGGQSGTPASGGPSGGVTMHSFLGSAPAGSIAFIARQMTGVAKSIPIGFAHPGGRSPGSPSYPRYPSPVANELIIQEPTFVVETLAYANHPARGILPGLASFLCNHTDLPVSNFPQRMTTTDGSNRTYLFAPYTVSNYPYNYDSCFSVKLSEPWR